MTGRVFSFGDLVAAGTLRIGDGHRAKLDELTGGGPCFLRAGALSDRGFSWVGLEEFGPDSGSCLDGKVGQAEDVVITTKGNSIGRVGFVPADPPIFVYSPHLSFWRSLDSEIVHPRYLYYWTRSSAFRDQLTSLAFGTDMAPYLSLRDQARFEIELPSPGEQRSIADMLGALDDKIAADEEVVSRAEALMVLLASQSDATCSIDKLAEHRSRGSAPESFAAIVALFSLPAFDEGAEPQVVAREEIKSNKFALEGSSVLVSKLNPRIPRIWNVCELPGLMAVASTEFVVLAPRELSASALWAAICQPAVSAELASKVAGTSGSHQRVKPADILDLSLPDPRRLSDQARDEIGRLGELAAAARRARKVLTATRDELLPLLMSGKVRVKDAEKVVEGVV